MPTANQKFTPGQAPVTIEQLAPRARFSLRLRPENAASFSATTGLSLPGTVGAVSRADETAVACVGPDEWLVVMPESEASAFAAAASGLRGKIPHALADLSDREVTFAIEGPEVLTLLSTGIARDVSAIQLGTAVRTLFDTASVILWRDDESTFRMDVWRSFAPHVRAFLDRAAQEIAIGL